MKQIFSKNNLFIETAFLLWFLFVYFAYMHFHGGLISFLPIVLGGILLLAFWYFVIRQEKTKFIDLKIDKPLWQAALFFLLVLVSTAIFVRLIGNIFTEKLTFIPFLMTEVGVIGNVLSKILFLSCLVLFCTSLGKKIFKLFKFNIENKKEEFIFSFGLGLLTINYLAFFLTALGWLYFWPSWILILLCAIFARHEIRYFVDNFLKTNFRFSISSDFSEYKNLKSWGWVLIGLFFVINFFISFRAFPVDYDDLDIYFNVPQLYSYYHHLVPFYNSISDIVSGISMTLHALINTMLAPHFAFHLNWLFFVFIIGTIYFFTNKFFSQKIAFLTLLLATFIPWNYFFITTQKVIFLLAFISILSILAFFNWLNTKKTNWLYLAAIFLGYGVSIKMNGLFLILCLSLFLGGMFVYKKIKFKQEIIFALLVFLFFLPTMSINIHYYNSPLAPFEILPNSKVEKIFASQKKTTLYDIYSKTNFAKQKSDKLTLFKFQNKLTDSKFINFFWRIWNITMNQKGFNALYVEISPYFLIFLPFFIFYFISKKYYQRKNFLHLSVIILIFLVLWSWKATERIWYSIPVFYFLFIFCSITLRQIKNKKYLFIFYFFIILFSIRTAIGSASAIPILPNTIYYSPQELKSQYNNISLFRMHDYINKEVINKNDNTLILIFLDSKIAYLKNNNRTAISDQFNIYWGKIIQEEQSPKEIKNILKTQGITHILYSATEAERWKYEYQNDPQFLMSIKIIKDLKKQHLKKIFCEEGLCLYEI